MMNNLLYPEIFKRKSFHLFRNVGSERIEKSELESIKNAYQSFDKLL